MPAECFGNEAVFSKNKLVGIITGGAYGHRVGHSIAFAYIEPSMCSDGEKLTVETSLGKRKCHVISEAVYDSGNNKLLS